MASSIGREVIVVSDAHHPFHDRVAWNVCLNAIRVVQPTDVVIIGDGIDCYSISQFVKSPERRASLKWEVEETNREFDRLQRAARNSAVHYLGGNHEYRFDRYIETNAPELWGMIHIHELLRIRDRGWNWTPYKKHINIGKIAYTHEIGRCGKNAIAQSLADFGHSIIIGHTHRLGALYGGTVRGERHVAMSVGWLGDFSKVDYKHEALAHREWQHGFGHVKYLRNGVGFVNPVPIINGVAVVDNVKVTG